MSWLRTQVDEAKVKRVSWLSALELENRNEVKVRIRKNRAVCSCYMCGNERRNDWLPLNKQRTMQERKQLDSVKDQLEELYFTEFT